MGLRLGSKELANEFWRLQKSKDPEFIEAFKGLNIRLILLGTDAPGKEDKQLFLHIENGQFVEITPETKPAPSDLRTRPFDHTKYDCRASAPQKTLVDLCSGRIDLIEAITKVKIEGDIGKLMSQFAEFMNFITYLGKKGIEP